MTAMLLLAVVGYLFILYGGKFVVDEKAVILPAASKVVAEDGTVISKIYQENRDYVTINDIPKHVEDAFLAVEDQRFYEHAGISFRAVSRAVYRDIIAMEKAEGGSTITQQLAKNLFLSNDKTWMRKTKEVMASIYLERNYSKEKILELYLNEIYLAHGVYGVGAAATHYFNKDLADITVDEAAMLAALAKAPNTYSPLINPELAKERRNLVLQSMANYDVLSTEEMMSLQGKNLDIKTETRETPPWFDDYLEMVIVELADEYDLSREQLKSGGYTIHVPIDSTIQEIAYEQFQNLDAFPGSNDLVDGAFVLMDEETGYIKALIGGRDYEIGDHHQALTKHQPGSVFKPVAVYGPAMMLGSYQPFDMIPDQRESFDGYSVSNANGLFDGEVTVYDAIVQSKNAPAVWLLDQIGISYSKSYLDKMDIVIEDDGLAIALGGLTTGVTPIEMTEAYRTFIHEGKWIQSSSITEVLNRNNQPLKQNTRKNEDVFDPQVAWNMVRMLETTAASGTARHGDFDKALAGKTGSTQHPTVEGMVKDAWFVGMTPSYVSAMWMGYDEANKSNYLTSGSEAPTKLTKSILTEVDKRKELEGSFSKPETVEELEDPIELPTISDLKVDYSLGGWTLIRGELSWKADPDERIVYEVYEKKDGEDVLLGTVTGKGTYTLDNINLFRTYEYYVVPMDPLTNEKGNPSNIAELSVDF